MRVTTNGQVTIPKEIRDHLGFKPGSEVGFEREADAVRLVAGTDASLQDHRKTRFREALGRMSGTIDPDGLDGGEYVAWLRGPREGLDLD